MTQRNDGFDAIRNKSKLRSGADQIVDGYSDLGTDSKFTVWAILVVVIVSIINWIAIAISGEPFIVMADGHELYAGADPDDAFTAATDAVRHGAENVSVQMGESHSLKFK